MLVFCVFLSLWPRRSLFQTPFLAPSWSSPLSDFAVGLEEDLLKLLLCPVRALRIYLQHTASFSPRHLFVLPRRPSHSLSKNAMSFLREVIFEADMAHLEVGSVREHIIRGVLTSAAFHSNWSVSSVLESATWRTNSVFASF